MNSVARNLVSDQSYSDFFEVVRPSDPGIRPDVYLRGSQQLVRSLVAPHRAAAPRELIFDRVTGEVVTDRKAAGRGTGLSNVPYPPVAVSDVKLAVSISPSIVRFSISDRVARVTSSKINRSVSMRGKIRELSARSRRRLQIRSFSLQAQGLKARYMMTLTTPANFQDVYYNQMESAGHLLKRQLSVFKKRLERFMMKIGVEKFSVMWFLEFQKRGAPHFHFLFFNCQLDKVQYKRLMKMCSVAWNEIVGNPDKKEKEKHKKAGTRLEKMRTEHFGYAAKYASKTEQKLVPAQFEDVGRFWGTWHHREPKPVVKAFVINTASDLYRAIHVIDDIVGTVKTHPFSEKIVKIVRSQLLYRGLPHLNIHQKPRIKHKMSFSVYGVDAVKKTQSYIINRKIKSLSPYDVMCDHVIIKTMLYCALIGFPMNYSFLALFK